MLKESVSLISPRVCVQRIVPESDVAYGADVAFVESCESGKTEAEEAEKGRTNGRSPLLYVFNEVGSTRMKECVSKSLSKGEVEQKVRISRPERMCCERRRRIL